MSGLSLFVLISAVLVLGGASAIVLLQLRPGANAGASARRGRRWRPETTHFSTPYEAFGIEAGEGASATSEPGPEAGAGEDATAFMTLDEMGIAPPPEAALEDGTMLVDMVSVMSPAHEAPSSRHARGPVRSDR